VLAADVYTNPQHAGRGGWTWYTGSAAWMYRLITESLLGLRLEVDHLRVSPLLPAAWPGVEIHYRHGNNVHHIHVRRGDRASLLCDGVEQADMRFLLDDKDHHVEVFVI
jgi:cellobiose phosphorylase